MLGGGTFSSQNKVLPGAYINYASVERATAQLGERGIGAIPMVLNWGKDKEVMTVGAEELQQESMNIFGYAYDAEEMKPIREVFRYAMTCLFYKLNKGTAASSDISEAVCTGTRGNSIRHVIQVNVDNESNWDVLTYVDTTLVDTQTVAAASELTDNAFVKFKKDVELAESAGINLTGGLNGDVTGAEHQEALKELEPHTFNALGCMSDDEGVKKTYAQYCKRMRDEVGAKFVLIVKGLADDYIGTINLKNSVEDEGADVTALIPWVVGVECSCAVNRTCENMSYDGEYTIKAAYSQYELKEAIKAGEFVFHQVGTEVRVLSDINSYVSVTAEMNEDFQLNQVIRVLDQIAIDIAAVFKERYLGKIQNDTDGRIAFWKDCVAIHRELLTLRAIEDFAAEDITVERGTGKRDVVENEEVKPVCAMSKLYMTIKVA